MSQVITTNHTYKNEKLFILIETIMPTIVERAVRHRHVIQIYTKSKKKRKNSVIFIEQKMQSDHKKYNASTVLADLEWNFCGGSGVS